MISDCANRILRQNATGLNYQRLGKNRVYDFIARLPSDLCYVKRKPIDKNRLTAENLSEIIQKIKYKNILLALVRSLCDVLWNR